MKVEKYMWPVIDGVKEKVENFRVEPSGLLQGLGEHPKGYKGPETDTISSLLFDAPRCAELPELFQVKMDFFSRKYGIEFVATATELMPEHGVNVVS